MEETRSSAVASPNYITTEEAARRLGVTQATVRSLLGIEIEAIRVGRVLRVDEGSLERYRQRQTVRPAS